MVGRTPEPWFYSTFSLPRSRWVQRFFVKPLRMKTFWLQSSVVWSYSPSSYFGNEKERQGARRSLKKSKVAKSVLTRKKRQRMPRSVISINFSLCFSRKQMTRAFRSRLKTVVLGFRWHHSMHKLERYRVLQDKIYLQGHLTNPKCSLNFSFSPWVPWHLTMKTLVYQFSKGLNIPKHFTVQGVENPALKKQSAPDNHQI